MNVTTHKDGLKRCPWPTEDALYVSYHDHEWGVPEFNDRALFEKLILDGFQAGLSWITILKKRENFRKAFDQFNPEKIASYDSLKIESLMQDTGIVRNRAKIQATITGAQIWLDIMQRGSFSDYLWAFVDGTPLQNNFSTMSDVPAETELSKKISLDLKKKGFKFCGPTIVYAFMQAVGMVNDHLVECHCHKTILELGKKGTD